MDKINKVIKIPEIEKIRDEANVWIGLHKAHGWVFFNREYIGYYFVKYTNWEVYEEKKENWAKSVDPDYLYYARFLALIPKEDLEQEKARALKLSYRYIEKKSQLDAEIENVIEVKKRKIIEDEKRKVEEQIRLKKEEAKEKIRLREENLERNRQALLQIRKSEIDNIIRRLSIQQNSDQNDIKNILNDKNIRGLVHFTNAKNIESIIKNGLLPKSVLRKGTYLENDTRRLDGYPEAISLSISYPNYRMFFKYRELNKNEKWIIVVVANNVVIAKPCMFFKTNAASHESQNLSSDLSGSIMGKQGLIGMFDEEVRGEHRTDLNIPDQYTTDPEAEILVFNRIEAELIKLIVLEQEDDCIQETISRINPSIPIEVLKGGFDARIDYLHWTRNAHQGSQKSFDEVF